MHQELKAGYMSEASGTWSCVTLSAVFPLPVSHRCTGSSLWHATLAQACGAPHWLKLVASHTGSSLWRATLAQACGKPHWLKLVARYTGSSLWRATLAQARGKPHWLKLVARHTG